MVQTSCWIKLRFDPCLSVVPVYILLLMPSLQSSLPALDLDLFPHHHPLCPSTPTKVSGGILWLQKTYLSLFIYWKSSELSQLVIAHVISVSIAFRAAELLLLRLTGEREKSERSRSAWSQQ